MEENIELTENKEEVEKVEQSATVEDVKPEESKEKPSKKAKKQTATPEIDDDLYAKVETEKLLQRKKKRKIWTTVGLAFIFALAVVLIVLASVPASLKPSCLNNEIARVYLFPGTVTPESRGVFAKGEEKYDKFIDLFDKSFKQTYISAIFDGSLFSYSIEEKLYSTSKVIGTDGTLVKSNTRYVRLEFAKEQTFTYQNGKAYVSQYRNSKWSDGKVTFKNVYFGLSEKDGFQTTEIYIVGLYPDSDTDNDALPDEKIITVTVKANTNEIYQEWKALTE